MCPKCDPFQACIGASPKYPGTRVAGSDDEEKERMEKSSLRCHVRLCEKADWLKALGSVADYLGNGSFYLINDTNLSGFQAPCSLCSWRMRLSLTDAQAKGKNPFSMSKRR